MTSNRVAIVNTWVRSGNEHITFDSDDMRPIANLARSQVLAAGFREYGKGKTIVSLSLAYNGLMVMVYTDTTSAVTAEKKLLATCQFFCRGTLRRCAGTDPCLVSSPGVQFLCTFVVFLCKKTDKLLATFFSAVTALVV